MIITVKGADFSACGIGKIITTISDECKEIASHYSKLKTVEDMAVLQQFMDDLGYGVENGIWSKLDCLFLPVFSSSKEEMLYDVRNSTLHSFRDDGAIFEAVSPWGMKVSESSPKDNYYTNLVKNTIEERKIYESTSFIAIDSVNADYQVGTCPPVSGVYDGNKPSGLSILIGIDDIQTTSLILGNNTLVSVNRWIDVNEDTSLKGKYKAWYDNGVKVTAELNMREEAGTLRNYIDIGFGAAYSFPPTFNSKMYVVGNSKLLSETECAAMRDALVTMLKSLGLK